MDVNSLFNEALLAQAAYATDLVSGMEDSKLIDALKKVEGVTQAQAEYFASKYKVIEQTENEETGFSATLFQEINEDGTLGEYHLATRGSASISNPTDPDWKDANLDNFNYGMSYDQVTDLLNFYLRLTHAPAENVAQFAFEKETIAIGSPPPSQPYIIIQQLEYTTQYLVLNETETQAGLGAIANTQQLNLAGHSLGGHLASAFTLLFPSIVKGTTTFNSAGIIGDRFDDFANVIAQAVNANGVANLQPDSVTNSSVTVTDIRAPLDSVSTLFNTSHLSGNLIDGAKEVRSFFLPFD